MTCYIALFRGINVGGNNKVSMAELKIAATAVGFQNVSTYINSGNVIFESDSTNLAALSDAFEALTKKVFGVTTRVSVISAAELADALKAAPDWWDTDPASKHNAIFVIAPASPDHIAAEVGDIKPEYEKVAIHGNVIFWSAPLKTFSRSRWSKIVGTEAYHNITIRNANTAKKLLVLTESDPSHS